MAQTSRIYNLYNLLFLTDLNLEKYFAIPQVAKAENQITVIEKNIEFKFLEIPTKKFDVYSSKNYAEIYKENVGLFVVEDGSKIYYQKSKNVNDPNFMAFTFSSVISYLLYQRDCLVIHASALEFDTNSFFFSGRSGVGKSFIANNLLEEANFLTEDICCFQLCNDTLTIAPSLPFIKLDKDSFKLQHTINFNTQTDARKRNIFVLDNHKENNNIFKGGFFLKIGKKNYIKKLEKVEAFKSIFANSFLHHPLNINIAEEKDLVSKISALVKIGSFYEIQRKENDNFNILEIQKVIQELS